VGPGELRINHEADGPRHTLVLTGELDLATAGELKTTIEGLCGDHASEIVLDLRRLDFLDSAGARAVAGAQEHCRERHCDFSLTPFSLTPNHQPIKRLYELSGLLSGADAGGGDMAAGPQAIEIPRAGDVGYR